MITNMQKNFYNQRIIRKTSCVSLVLMLFMFGVATYCAPTAQAKINVPDYVHTNEFKQLNNIYFFDKDARCLPGTAPAGSAVAAPGESTGAQVYNFLIGKGLSPIQALGVVGNLMQESGRQTLNLNPAIIGGPSIGIAQWLGSRRYGSTLDSLEGFAASMGLPETDLNAQMGFLWHELTNGYKSDTLDPLLATGSLEEAVSIVLNNYERPKVRDLSNRLSLATQAAAELGVDINSTSAAMPSATLATSGATTTTVNCGPTAGTGATGSSAGVGSGTSSGCASNIIKGWERDGTEVNMGFAPVVGTVLAPSSATAHWSNAAYEGATAFGCTELVMNTTSGAALAQAAQRAAQDGVTLTGTAAYRSLYEQCSIVIKSNPRPSVCPDWITPVPGNWTSSTIYSNHMLGNSVDFTQASEDWMRQCATQSLDGTADGKCFGFVDDVYRSAGWDSAHFTYIP